MNKRLKGEFEEFIYHGEKTPFSFGTVAVVIFCVVLLICATFTKIDFSHPWFTFSGGDFSLTSRSYQLIPQIPVVIFTSAILGARFGAVVMILYLLVGFFVWPVFGFGGGVGYIKSHFFGYILGFIIASIFSGRILSTKYNLKNMIYATLIGVISIHLCGMFYSFVLGFFKTSYYAPSFGVVCVQVIYDVIFSFCACAIAIPVKYLFWIAMKNEPKRLKNKV